LGIDNAKARIYAPSIPGFQRARSLEIGSAFPVQPGRGWLLVVDEHRGRPIPVSPEPGQRMVFEDEFSGQELDPSWRVQRSEATAGRVQVDGGHLVVSGPQEGAALAEHDLPADAQAVECRMVFPMELRRPQTLWEGGHAPGLAVVWPERTLRICAATQGWVNVDDGVIYEFYGNIPLPEGSDWYTLRIWWDEQYVYAEASADGEDWDTLRAMPRPLFEGEPTLVRLGKMDRFGRAQGADEGGPQEARFDYLRIRGG
jgi:hypothetical protein